MDTIYLIGRLILGSYFVLSGLNHLVHLDAMTGYTASKGLPSPKAGVAISGLALILGGLGVLLHIELVASYVILIAFLLAAAFLMHNYWKAKDPMSRMADEINFRKNIALAAALAMLLVQAAA